MRSRILLGVLMIIGAVILAQPTYALTYTVNEITDLYTIGDFIVAGGADKSSPGLVFEVLGGPANDLHNTPSETGARSSSMGSLWNVLNTSGISSTNTLVFGFGLNETGSPGTNPVNITDLEMVFNLPNSSSVSFDLGENNVFVYGNQGASGSEARFQVNLDFDFMTTFNGSSTELFNISSTILGTDDGPEIYFLDAGFTANPPQPVPEPATMLLLGTGLVGLAGASRKKFLKKVSKR